MATGNRNREPRLLKGTRKLMDSIQGWRKKLASSDPLGRSLRFEPLEDRRLLAVFSVKNLEGDNTIGSFANIINLTNGNGERDTVFFEDYLFDGLTGNAIGLDGVGTLNITDGEGIEIIGPGAGVLTIYADENSRLFVVDDTDPDHAAGVTIRGLTLSGGSPLEGDQGGLGGAILNRESLTLEEVHITGNHATGGGAVHNDAGSLTIERSLIESNTAAQGGGIQNGIQDSEIRPATTIHNSTITGNAAVGGVEIYGYGGGVLNLAGTVTISQSTIYGNSASGNYSYGLYGGGVASLGFDPQWEDGEEGEEPVATVTSGAATTNFHSSIIAGNSSDDVVSIGMIEPEEEAPAEAYQPQMNSFGYNLFGMLNIPGRTVEPGAVTLPPNGPDDVDGVDPADLFIEDALTGETLLDYGGVLPVYMPDINKQGGGLAIDHGDPGAMAFEGNYDQRGYQFTRVFDATGNGDRMDIGAAEAQIGNFVVDALVDEDDGRYRNVPVLDYQLSIPFMTYLPDFSLREALDFAEKNLKTELPDDTPTITFSDDLTDPELNEDPNPFTDAPTILLDQGQFLIGFPVFIEGPAFELEIDANDTTPTYPPGDGSRIFYIYDEVEISNLTLRNGDAQQFGGAIYTSGDLTLRNMTIMENSAIDRGGAIFVNGGTLLMENSAVIDNDSSTDGGGIYIQSGVVTLSNSTISGNTSELRGGGIANYGGYLTIQYSTVTLNTALPSKGGGVASFRDGYAETYVRSSIIAGNAYNDDIQHVMTGTDNITSLGYNVVGAGNAVTSGAFSEDGDQTGVFDPMLAPLARLGGFTPIHRLLPGSPAIDMGDPNAAGLGNVPDYDQRGLPFDRIESGTIDIGAYETQDGMLLVGDGSAAEGSYATFMEAVEESNLTPDDETIVILPTYGMNELFPGVIEITDSVDIYNQLDGLYFYGIPAMTVLIDDGDEMSLIDVSIDNLDMQNDARIVSKENLTLSNMEFRSNSGKTYSYSYGYGYGSTYEYNNGGAISQEGGKLTITGSFFIDNSVEGAGYSGGAVHVLDGDLEINDTFMTGNTALDPGGNGGAIFIENGNFTANYLYLTGNAAASGIGDGGAIFGRNSTMSLSNLTISGNTTAGSNSEGGGIAAIDSDVAIADSLLAFNTTVGTNSKGGAVYLNGGSLYLNNVNLFSNSTEGMDASGGAVAAVNADVTIYNTSVNENSTSGLGAHGGGVYVANGNLTVRDSSIVNNDVTATDGYGTGAYGGGIYTDTDLLGTQTAIIKNSTVSGNTSQSRGGGIYNADGLLVIKHSTITNNEALLGMGGGIASHGDAQTRTEVLSSIVSGNFANNTTTTTSDDVSVTGGAIQSFLSLGYNLVGSGIGGSAITAFSATGDLTGVNDPMLGTLGFNGGTTMTHVVLEDSLAINAGDPDFDPNDFTPAMNTDQRGADRVQVGRIDIGAVESSFAPTMPSDFDGDADIDGRDFLAWQRGKGTGPGADKSEGDANSDGYVDDVDLGIWAAGFGTSTSSVPASAPTSEPDAAPVTAPVTAPATASVDEAVAAEVLTAEVVVAQSEPIVAGTLRVPSADLADPVPLPAPATTTVVTLATPESTTPILTVDSTPAVSVQSFDAMLDLGQFAARMSLGNLGGLGLSAELSVPLVATKIEDVAARDALLAQLDPLADELPLLADVELTAAELVGDGTEDADASQDDELLAEDEVFSLLGAAVL